MRTVLTVAMIAGAALLAHAAAAVTIAEVLADPDAYAGQSVTLVGTVEVAIPVGSESGYNLRDGRSAITVVSRSAPPADGAHLAVTGTVHLFSEGGEEDDPESNHFPPGLYETARNPAP
jgi:hypothetical protein